MTTLRYKMSETNSNTYILEWCYLYTQKVVLFGTTLMFFGNKNNKVRGGEREWECDESMREIVVQSYQF
jgi:hypothetical protein